MTITEFVDTREDADVAGDGGGLPRILIVDDDQTLLRSMKRILRNRYDVQTESNPYRALVALEDDGPFAVIVSDLTMPGVDGIDFLVQAHAEAPETTRILLTGNATLPASIDAVNRAQITSLLTKPVTSEALLTAIHAAVLRHEELVGRFDDTADILEGSAEALLETLAIANPTAHTLTRRVRALVDDHLAVHPRSDAWELMMAANLCYLGSAALGSDLSRRVLRGDPVAEAEGLLVGCVAAFTVDIVARIPRLANVEDILRHHRRSPGDGLGRRPAGAQLLGIFTTIAELELSHEDPAMVAQALEARTEGYDPELLAQVLSIYVVRPGPRLLLDDDGEIIDLGDN